MRIEHVTLLVNNRGATLEFFKDKLGFEYRFVNKHAWVIVGDQYIHITEDSGSPVGNTFHHFCIERDDITEYAKQLRDKGVELIDEDEGKAFFVRDLDGNLIEFMKPWNPDASENKH